MIRVVPFLIFFTAALHAAPAEPDFTSVRAYLDESVDDGTVAGGAVLVLYRGEVVFETGFGYADIASKKPYQIDTPCVVASISKPLLGTAVFHLAERGEVDLEVPVTKYLPEFEGAKLESGELLMRAPTLIELFTHTSGLRFDEAPGGRPWYASWSHGKPLSFVVGKMAREFPFKAQPGTRYAYSGIGTEVAARIAEVTSGKTRNEFLVAEFCRPLGMTSTYYRDADSLEKAGPMPTRYYRGKDGGLLVSKKRPVPPPNTYSSSGGSVISTAPDLARWLLMIRNRGHHEGKPYLTARTVQEMLAGTRIGSNARGGFFRRKKDSHGRALVVGHTGSSGTNCWIDFENDLIGIMLTQTRGKHIKPFRLELEKRITACVTTAKSAEQQGKSRKDASENAPESSSRP